MLIGVSPFFIEYRYYIKPLDIIKELLETIRDLLVTKVD
jgi:hypothetical protein